MMEIKIKDALISVPIPELPSSKSIYDKFILKKTSKNKFSYLWLSLSSFVIIFGVFLISFLFNNKINIDISSDSLNEYIDIKYEIINNDLYLNIIPKNNELIDEIACDVTWDITKDDNISSNSGKFVLTNQKITYLLCSNYNSENIKVDLTLLNKTLKTYNVTWKNEDVVISSDIVNAGEIPQFKYETPVKEKNEKYSYKFIGWDIDILPASKDITYNAVFKEVINTYKVNFISDGKVIKTIEVEYGDMPIYDGEVPTKPATKKFSYTFEKWDREFVSVKSDCEYNALFSESINYYKVEWMVEGQIVQSEMLEYNSIPIYKQEEPYLKPTADFKYEFIGWNREIKEVDEDILYIAVFDKIPIDKPFDKDVLFEMFYNDLNILSDYSDKYIYLYEQYLLAKDESSNHVGVTEKGIIYTDIYGEYYNRFVEYDNNGYNINYNSYNDLLTKYNEKYSYVCNKNELVESGKNYIYLKLFDSFADANKYFISGNLFIDKKYTLLLFSLDYINKEEVDINYNKYDDKTTYTLRSKIKYLYLLDDKLISNSFSSQIIKNISENYVTINIEFYDDKVVFDYQVDGYQYLSGIYRNCKFKYKETYLLEGFNNESFDNYLDDNTKYTYSYSKSIDDVYHESNINEEIYTESVDRINKSYYKFYLEPGQYLVNYKDLIHPNYNLYNNDKELIDLGIKHNNYNFDLIRYTFTISKADYYYFEFLPNYNCNNFVFSLDKLEDDTYYDIFNPIELKSGKLELSFDTPYELYIFNYHSDDDGILYINDNTGKLVYYAYSYVTNSFTRLFHTNTYNIKKGDNIIYIGLNKNYPVDNATLEIEFTKSEYIDENIEGNKKDITKDYFENDIAILYGRTISFNFNSYGGNYKFNFYNKYELDNIYVVISDGKTSKTVINDEIMDLPEGNYIVSISSYGSVFNIKYSEVE